MVEKSEVRIPRSDEENGTGIDGTAINRGVYSYSLWRARRGNSDKIAAGALLMEIPCLAEAFRQKL
jgi:hypothetical protein